jgi:hypothetical protein
MNVVITEECSVMVNSDKLIGTTEHMTLYARFHINQCRYNRIQLYMLIYMLVIYTEYTHTYVMVFAAAAPT